MLSAYFGRTTGCLCNGTVGVVSGASTRFPIIRFGEKEVHVFIVSTSLNRWTSSFIWLISLLPSVFEVDCYDHARRGQWDSNCHVTICERVHDISTWKRQNACIFDTSQCGKSLVFSDHTGEPAWTCQAEITLQMTAKSSHDHARTGRWN